MKKCPKCGYLIENDYAKFCKKCGAKQPECVVEIQNDTAINPVPNENVSLNISSKRQIADNWGQNLSPNITKEKTTPEVTLEENGLLWAVKTCFGKYATFDGRAPRSEYWFFFLFNCIISSILLGLALAINQDNVSLIFLGLYFVYSLVILLPSLAVTVRRLHDIGISGWWYCIGFVPYVGAFILLYFLCKKSV